MLSYHYVFLAVSLALLGLGAGGVFVHFFRPKIPSGSNRFATLALFASLFALAISLSVLLTIQIGYIDNILLYFFPLLIPFFLAGVLLAEAFRMFPVFSAWIYGADLVGAAFGAFIAILALDILGGISTSFLLGVLASLAALLFTVKMLKKNRQMIIPVISFLLLTALLGTTLTGLYQPDVPVGTNPDKAIHDVLSRSSSYGELVETRWSAFGRTDLVKFNDYPEQMWIYVDGTAGTPMYQFSGNFSNPGITIDRLKTDFLGYFPFLFFEEEVVCPPKRSPVIMLDWN